MLTDAKQTLRSLARAPWHVVTVSLCLGIGIAVSVTVFSILSSILTGELPGIHDRNRLMRVVLAVDQPWGRSWSGASLADFEVLKAGSPHMPSIGAEGAWEFAISTPRTGPLAVEGAFVSGSYFEVLGTRPALGRVLTAADDRAGAASAAVLSHAFWTATLGAPADIVGTTIQIGGRDVVVAGVAPEHFSGTDVGALGEPPGLRYKVYLPLSLARTLASGLDERESWLNIVGRAAGDTSPEALSAELQPLATTIAQANPEGRKNAAAVVMRSGASAGDTMAVVATIIALLMAAPLTVLAIGCANVANLQLVRASLRARELAVRLSIGATRGQLVRLLTLEAALLAVAGCGVGFTGTVLLLRIAALVIPFNVAIDWPVLLFIVAIGALVVVATGVVPGWLATRSPASLNLAGSGRSGAPAASRTRRALVVAQIALCLLLLATAALFTRTLDGLLGSVPASAHEITVAEIRFDTLGYSQAQREAFVDAFRERVGADARVQSVGFSSIAPLRTGGRQVWLPGDSVEQARSAGGGDVTAEWPAAAGLTMVRGRTFTPDEMRHGNAALVDLGFIEKHRLQEPVIGTQLRVEQAVSARPDARSINEASSPAIVPVTIVGVVSRPMARPMAREPEASLYVPLRDAPDYVSAYVRSSSGASIINHVRQTMVAIDPELPPIRIATLATRFDDEAGDIRLVAQAASGLGMAALLLAVAGVYSVIAFFVSLRTHEFGIRVAIGARPRDILNMVLLQASRLVGLGLIAGGGLAVPVLMGLGKVFPSAPPLDAIGLFLPSAALALTALAAAGLPARKAARTDPSSALRAE
jgi:putative ABC transport system permease protein